MQLTMGQIIWIQKKIHTMSETWCLLDSKQHVVSALLCHLTGMETFRFDSVASHYLWVSLIFPFPWPLGHRVKSGECVLVSHFILKGLGMFCSVLWSNVIYKTHCSNYLQFVSSLKGIFPIYCQYLRPGQDCHKAVAPAIHPLKLWQSWG